MNKGYVRIKPKGLLRGWKGIPAAVVDWETGRMLPVTEPIFRTLKLCNGMFPSDSPVFLGERQKHLEYLNRFGIIEYLHEPLALDPKQEYRYFDNRYIGNVHWSLTGHCNYRCRHCYMRAPHQILPQPSLEKCLEIADEIADCGVTYVSLTGGEPLIRSDFLDIIDRILERDMRVDMIMTNGSLVDETLLDALRKRNCYPEFNMSFDGTKEWHDWLRGVDGAFDSVCRAFRLCREKGFRTGAELVLHKGNRNLLRESVRLLGNMGVSSLKVAGLRAAGEGASISEQALTMEEVYECFLEYIPQYIEDGMPVPSLMLAGLFTAVKGKYSIGAERHPEGQDCLKAPICAAARKTMYLGPDGYILPCIPMSEQDYVQNRFPNINQMTLKQALKDSFYIQFIRTTLGDYLDHNPGCRGCEYQNRCGGGCRGQAVSANGGADLLGIDPDVCLLFQGGYYERARVFISSLEERKAE